ncbi:MAG: TAXI family TRAP transporter solute-binding subunit [Xenococcaceae cyanobacterium]
MLSKTNRSLRNSTAWKICLPIPFNFLRGRRFKLIGLGGILSAISPVGIAVLTALSLSSCTIQPITVTLSTGSNGSGYKEIGKQISISASTVGKMTVQDNYDSQGSLQNLQRLLDKEVDFAILQLDVASEAMKKGQIKTIVVLTQEYVHIVTRADSGIQTFADLEGKRVAVGAPGSGIYFTAKRLFQATNLNIQEDKSNKGLKKLLNGEVDAFIYVGPLGTSERLRTELTQSPRLRFIPIDPSLVNYLTIQFPESYRGTTIPKGIYKPLPELPRQDLSTISTAGALVTRPDVDKDTVALLTWSILSTVRQYSPFYPDLATDRAQSLVHEGLIYVHPGAQQAFVQGDPRVAWLHYIQQNKPLQAALIMLTTTSTIGFLLRWWRKQRCANLIEANRKAVSELRSLLEQNSQQALEDVEALRQQHRLMLIDGAVSTDVYEQIEQMTQVFADQCRTLEQQQRQASVHNLLDLIDKWEVMLQTNPEIAVGQLREFEQKYREMLLSGQVDIQTYLQLKQVNLILVMLFVSPQALPRKGYAIS